MLRDKRTGGGDSRPDVGKTMSQLEMVDRKQKG